jgi:tetratricopeptide (TPR) repeat protein
MTKSDVLTSDKRKQAEALLRSNRLREARELYQEICLLDKGDADLWLVLGSLNGRLGDATAAEACIRNAIALRPNWAIAHFNLGISLRDQHRLAEATEAFRVAVQLKADYADAHNAIGYVLVVQGQVPAAEQHFRQAIALNPRFADAHNNLGNVLRAQSRNDEAIASYRNAIEAQPENIDAMLNLAGLLGKMTRIEEAIEWDRRILALRPNFAEAHYHLGNALLGVDKLEEAVECFRSAQRIKPDFTEAIGAEAQALQKLGRYDESCERILPALERGVKSAAIVAALAAVAKRIGRREETTALAEEMLRQNKLSGDERRQLHFAAGKLYDELERYQEAFEHFRQANALYRGRFAREEHGKMVNDAIALFQTDRMRNMPKAKIMSDRPVFIVGMPRSGTSLVEQILASHPRIFGAGELNDINQYANGMQARLGAAAPYPACLGWVTQTVLDGLAQRYLDRLLAMEKTAARVTDKMPHNFLHLGMIAMLFPGARIIHTMRDPMDTCLSIYFQQFNDLHAYAHNLSDLGYYYRSYEKLMTHWRSVLDLPLLEVRYEELVTDPNAWIPRLVEFCGVEWVERCLQFHKTKRAVNTPSTEQVREPMYSRSVGRWRHYETQLEPLRIALEQKV